MTIFLYENNLLWSSRLRKTLEAKGHTVVICPDDAIPEEDAQVAIVNLAPGSYDFGTLVPQLQSKGLRVIGHAGHKEKDLLKLGQKAGCDCLATNSQITFKTDELLREVFAVTN